MSTNVYQQAVFDHIKKVCVFSDVAVTPRIFTSFTHSPLASMLLGQIVYWSGVTKHADGYFWKSIPQWQEELGFSYHQVTYCLAKLVKLGVITTCLRPIAHRLTTHYKLNLSRLIELIDQAAAKQPVAIAPDQDLVGDTNNFGGDPTKSEVVLTLNHPLNNAREEKESLLTLASLAYAGAQPKPADAPVALVTFAPTMQADLSFVNPAATQSSFLGLPPVRESTGESKDPLADPTKEIAIRNKINPPKLPDCVANDKPAKSRKAKAPRDPLLDAPAVKIYRGIAHAQMAACVRESVAKTVGDDYDKVRMWGEIIKLWIMRGYNPRNIDGMLEAFKAGGLKPNGYKKADTGIPGMTPRTATSNPLDPDGYVQNHTPKDVWDKTDGDTGLCLAYVNIKANPRMRGEDWAIKAIAGLREKGVEI